MSGSSAAKAILESFIEHEKEPHFTGEKPGKPYKREITTRKAVAVGVIYAEIEQGEVTFKVLYAKHIEQAVKDEIASRFGCGAREWSNVG